MKKNAGILTAVAVVLAFFGISNLPKSSPGGAAATETGNGAKSPSKDVGGHTSSPYPPCEQIQRRLQPFVTSFPQQTWALPRFCYSDPPPANSPKVVAKDVDFVIATVPNPISTHLPLAFDRMLEIIQQAAQDNGYLYVSSWLPWNEAKDYSRLPDQLLAQDSQSFQESQPGLLVFRKPLTKTSDPPEQGGLAVFIVSELPTGGIDQLQFDNALAWIEQLGALSPDRGLNILGPSFSGSLPSLYRCLRFPKLASFLGKSRITIVSGSVSSELGYDWFKDRLDNDGLGTFQTMMEGDSVLIKRFCDYIDSQHYRTDRVAILSEDETAYGGATGEGLCGGNLTYLYYPRDIATLRSAYEQQSIFSSNKQPSGTNAAPTSLRGDLSEPANSEHDTVRSYGGQLTPLAQESVLFAITDILKEKKIQFVIVRSTNSLDQIFLSQFLRRSFPETRIVLDGADLLFRRGAEGASLRGVMVLSTYPLLTWQQDWTSSPPTGSGGSYRIFGQDSAEGLYIAARTLFPNQGSDVIVANDAPPTWARSPAKYAENSHPATWLTVIGHRQFWPVAVLNSYTLQKEPAVIVPNVMPALPVEFWMLLTICLAWGLLHFLWCARGSISPVPAPFRLAYFAPIPRPQHTALIAFGSALVASVAVVVAAAAGLLNWELGNSNGLVAAFAMTLLLLAYLSCVKNYQLPSLPDGIFTKADFATSRRVAAVAFTLFLVAFMLLHNEFIRNLITANRIPAYWRSVRFLSGVSALLPQLFLVAGMYCWFWFSLRGLALFGNDRPLLPKQSDLTVDGKPIAPMFSREQAGTPTEDRALPLGILYLGLLVLILPIVVIVCLIVLQGDWLRTLGERIFGVYIFFWLTLCIAMILTDSAQCWSTWKRLQGLLIDLDRLPLRRTLNALQGLSWRSVWAMSGDVLMERYCLVSRQIEALRHLANRIQESRRTIWPDPILDELQAKIAHFQDPMMKDLVAWYVALDDKPVTDVEPLRAVQEEIASIAAFVLANLLLPAWHTETDSLILDRSRTKNADTENSGGPAISPHIPSHIVAAEEFFVLPYVGFIQNILGRVRASVLGSLCLFVAATLAVSSYPFDPLPVLGGIFLAVFVITGVTMIVIYAGMHRDATLSYITGTRAGELGVEFWRQLITFGVGPLLGLLTTLFPSMTDFVISWLQPGSQAIK
jgi:hypothetical protein